MQKIVRQNLHKSRKKEGGDQTVRLVNEDLWEFFIGIMDLKMGETRAFNFLDFFPQK